MIPYQKYFVSQHFGKSLGTVALAESRGSVTIELARSEKQKVKFYFCPERLANFQRDEEAGQETALRIAIQQAHKMAAHDGMAALMECEHELALETAPWLGDLTEVPYGGATSGYETLVASTMNTMAEGTRPRPR